MPAPEQIQSYSDEWLRSILERYKSSNMVQRLMFPELYPRIDWGNGSYSSHLMSSDDRGAFPTLTYDPKTNSLIGGGEARDRAMANGDYIPMNERDADYFAREYKRAFPPGWFK